MSGETEINMNLPTLKDSMLQVKGRVALLTLMRNDVRNALTGTFLADDIVQTVNWANIETGLSALIIFELLVKNHRAANNRDERVIPCLWFDVL